MKILHINKFFDLHGGAEVAMHDLIVEQQKAGHEVHVFSTRSPSNLPTEDTKYFVERFDLAIFEGPWKDLQKAGNYLWNREAKRSVSEMLKKIRPDVIHLHNIYHHLSTSILDPIRRSGIPCVQTLHDYKLACPNYAMFTEGSPCERCKGGRYLEAVKHHCLSASTAGNVLAALEMGMTKMFQSYERTVRTFICPSEFLRDKMVAWGEPAAKMVVIPNAVSVSKVSATCDGGYLLATGRLSPEKGLDVLIRAMAQIPDVRLCIAGIGSEEARLRTLKDHLGAKNVEFLGYVRRTERQDLWLRATALVHPSQSYDNAPLSVLEAMAMGLPVVGSRIGGIPELIDHEQTGLLVEPRDVSQWVMALKKIVQLSQSERTTWSRAAIEKVKDRFSWEVVLPQIMKTYHR